MFYCYGDINEFELSAPPLKHIVKVSFPADLFLSCDK